jgi:CRISPR-associated protein Cas2
MSRWMRILVFFDLPVKTKIQRRNYSKFRNFLLDEGFHMMQFSVYSRVCNGHETTERIMKRLEKNLPPKGSIRSLTVTEKQYARMNVLLGEKLPNEKKITTDQLSLF